MPLGLYSFLFKKLKNAIGKHFSEYYVEIKLSLVILQKKLITWVEGEATSLKMGRDIIKYQKKSFNIFQIQREREKKILSSLVKTQIPIKHSTYVCK